MMQALMENCETVWCIEEFVKGLYGVLIFIV